MVEENNPFDHNRNTILFFSTGFTSTADDAINAERATEVEREMQIKRDGKVSDIDYGGEVQDKCLVIAQEDFQG